MYIHRDPQSHEILELQCHAIMYPNSRLGSGGKGTRGTRTRLGLVTLGPAAPL